LTHVFGLSAQAKIARNKNGAPIRLAAVHPNDMMVSPMAAKRQVNSSGDRRSVSLLQHSVSRSYRGGNRRPIASSTRRSRS
jgi:hypothetical protein